MRLVSLNVTNAIPKRVLQISSVLSEFGPVDQLVWNRKRKSNYQAQHQYSGTGLIGYLVWVWKTLRREQYEAILFDDMRLLPIVTAVTAIQGGKVIYNRQEVPTLNLAQAIKSILPVSLSRALKISEFLEGIFLRSVDVVLTIPLVPEGIQRLKGFGKPLYVLWNLPDGSEPAVSSLPSKDSDVFRMIYTGALTKENGIEQYLRLVDRFGASHGDLLVELILVGHSQPGAIDSIERAALQSDNVDVRILDWVPYEDLFALFSCCDVALAFFDPRFEKYKYLEEGASRKIFTYMAAGMPILAAGAFGEIVVTVGCGYHVDYANEDAQIAALDDLSRHGERMRTMGSKGRNAVDREYNWTLARERVLRFLQCSLM